MIARSLGARVVGVDPSAAAREAAVEAGAAAVLDPQGGTPHELADRLAAMTGGGAHVSIEALGHPAAAVAGVLALRRRGRHVQVGLLLGDQARPALPMDRVIAWELELYGSHGMSAHDYPAMLAAIADGRLAPDRLVGAVVGLDSAADALAALGTPGAARAGMTVVVP